MATSQSKMLAGGREEVGQTVRVYKRRVWFFFKVESEEVVKSDSIGNDIFVRTDRPIRDVFINNVHYIEG